MDIQQLRKQHEDIDIETLIDIIDEVVVRKGGKRSKPLHPPSKPASAARETRPLEAIPCWGRTPAGERCPNARIPKTDWCRAHTPAIGTSGRPLQHAPLARLQEQTEEPTREPTSSPVEQTGSFVEQTEFFEAAPAPAPVTTPTRPRCHGLTKAGAPCRVPPRRQRDFCFNHDPEFADQQRANVRAAGRASGAARRKATELPVASFVNLIDRSGVQAAIDAMFRLELFGKIPPARSRVFVRLLSLAVRNFDNPHAATASTGQAAPVRAAHDDQAFSASRLGFDEHSSEIVTALDYAELSRRVQEIQDVGSKRSEYLKINDMWKPPEPRGHGPGDYLMPFYGS